MMEWQSQIPALGLAIVAAGLAGFSRGFAAFGAATIYIPLVTLAYDAKTAIVTLFLVDIVPSLPLVWNAAPRFDRPMMSWMAAGALLASPLGVCLRRVIDPAHVQLLMGILLLVTISHMMTRRRLRTGESRFGSLIAGAVSGFLGGLCGIFGPPAMIYLLGRSADARQSRADAIVYLTGQSIILGAIYLIYGMYTRWYLELSLMLAPLYGLSMWYGARRFSLVSEAAYRRIVLALLWAVSALLVFKGVIAPN